MDAVKLNIGCGYDIRKGYINIDVKEGVGVDLVLDATSLHLPFDDNSVDEILLYHVLEHMVYRYEFIEECKRILKKDGLLHIKLPTNAVSLAHQSYTHRKDFFKCVTDDKKSGGLQKNKEFRLIYQRRNLNHPLQLYFRLRDWFLNLFTTEWEYMLKKN